VKIAEGFGVKGRMVVDKNDLDAALIEMIEHDGPFVLDVHVPHQEHVLPMIPAGMTVKDIIKT
jgi:acetolactate synthase-1/2/3 large subunit